MEVIYKEHTVRDDGTVINKYGKNVGFKNGKGYRYVYVEDRKIPLHRFIWEAFNGEIPEGMEIDHINTIRDDNRLCNLRMVSSSQNKRNPITIEKYKQSNKNKGSYKQRMLASMLMWFHNKIREHHKNLEKLRKVKD